MRGVALFSKNQRSFELFRKCWLLAAERAGVNPVFWNRGIGISNLLRSLYRYIGLHKSKRFVFGFTEILIYIPFSKKSDVFVFTGLGRLLLRDGFVRFLLKKYFMFFYKHQSVVVLNADDKNFLIGNFEVNPLLINGEGYFFSNLDKPRVQRDAGLRFAYVGRLLKSKQVGVILDAFSRLPLSGCRLSLYGDSDFGSLDSLSNDEIENYISKSNNLIVREGYCEDVKKELFDIDVVISMSEREGLPFSVLDAIDAGCYIILSPVPGHLSFQEFEGVTYCSVKNLYECLLSFLEKKTDINGFDPVERIRQADHKFGHKKIIDAIGNILRD